MIRLIRIDDRLLHGQVSFTWVPSLKINCIVIANNKVATDEFQKMALNIAKPPSAKLLIYTLKDAIAFLCDAKARNQEILVLVNSIADALSVAKEINEIKTINFGGIRMKTGAKLISKAIAIDDNDITFIKELLERGLELEIRQVPGDKKTIIDSSVINIPQ
ncbi:MAG: PTS sugar transporter subunit IIB [Bacteroidales bacterium]|jgi:mannose/fructose/N-acetylgalactosamine-specific phosphotransferase system component IIB|nr:PTS sugar transporter subunit IIB [Bacteroidales bacterium]